MYFVVTPHTDFEQSSFEVDYDYERCKYEITIASYPGHVGGGKSSLMSTICACANESDYGDKLHVLLLRFSGCLSKR